MSALRFFDKFAKLLDVNWGAIADGQFLKRSGSTIIGSASGGSGDVVGPASAVADNLPQFSGTTGKLLKDGKVAPAGAIVGTTDTQTLNNKSINVGGLVFRPSGVLLIQTVTVSSGATTLSPWTLDIPPGLLARDGDSLRVTALSQFNSVAVSKSFTVRLGGVAGYVFSSAVATGINATHVVLITRMTASTQKWSAMRSADTGSAFADVFNGSIDTTTTQVLETRVGSSGAGISALLHSMVEFLPAP